MRNHLKRLRPIIPAVYVAILGFNDLVVAFHNAQALARHFGGA